ncbi:MAG: helix-turn-helix transcriptional regulator [Anaerolineae bacterium]|nr:helix-turn-helix transcriptional regulator [Anaerolineae bacterium]
MVEWLTSLLKRKQSISLKEREIQILCLLSKGLNYYEIADALQISHEATKKDIQSIYRELDVHCKEDAIRQARVLKILDGSQGDLQQSNQAARLTMMGIGVLAVALLASRLVRPFPDPCAEFADLTQRKWEELSAVREDTTGTGMVVRESGLTDYFGKVESETLIVDVSRCPILRIGVAHVEPEAGYTIQVLDKRSDKAFDVLIDNQSRDWTIDLTQAVDWQQPELQPRSFTINIWVSGEGKSVSFSHISLVAQR